MKCERLVHSLLFLYSALHRQLQLGLASETSPAQSRGSCPGHAFTSPSLCEVPHRLAAGCGLRDYIVIGTISEVTSRPSQPVWRSSLASSITQRSAVLCATCCSITTTQVKSGRKRPSQWNRRRLSIDCRVRC